MPLYEYRCRACGRSFEFLQRLDDPPMTVCPECGGELQKQLSAPAFQFKGSGWYVTDYAKKGGGRTASEATPKADASQVASGDGATGGKSDTSSESKPAAKSDGSASTASSASSKPD